MCGTKRRILRFTPFESDAWGGGGKRRSAQVSEILSEIPKVEVLSINKVIRFNNYSLKRAIGYYQQGLAIKRKHQIPCSNHLLIVANLAIAYKQYLELIRTYWPVDKIIWESGSGYSGIMDFVLPCVAVDLGVDVIALPHNLDSLVPTRRFSLSGEVSPNWLNKEIHFLKKCSQVFTISAEELWLLQLHAIPTSYLPYYPSEPVAAELQKIRDFRSASQQSEHVLMLGTARNPPTRMGMEEALNHLTNTPIEVIVAGFGTETLQENYKRFANIHVQGEITHEQLMALLRRVKAALIHTVPSSGALTRIPELLKAGLPVVTSEVAARSYNHIEGIHIYKQLADIPQLLMKKLSVGDYPSIRCHIENFIKYV
ncbi:hypothetical protein SAMN05421823_10750 [Catalinimonas alkaloidigena]|uniref:Uncharacterized protein n=1 Tax=Catalinimonas alkaloidigena TaxID=1075417 RepID=A0A1G9LHD0_9BACT|nr:hypothetical protein [Catalinimonas alkaloidigena]SDL61379.1 hypothetical protein SAMN05421823_10750 [Catalinimonas alkaloidigena]